MSKKESKSPSVEQVLWSALNSVYKEKDNILNWWSQLLPLFYLMDNNLDVSHPENTFNDENTYMNIMNKWIKDQKCQEYVFVINNPAPSGKVLVIDDIYNSIMTVYLLHKTNKSLFDELKSQK